MNKFDFRLIDKSDLPIMNDEHIKNIKNKIGDKCYTNNSQKQKYIIYVFENLTQKCAYCGVPLDISVVEEIDHFIPKNADNCNDISNLVVTCRNCNRSKSSKIYPKEFYPYSKKYSELFTRNKFGQIIPTDKNKELALRFSSDMKFASLYYQITYVSMLIDEYLKKKRNDNADLYIKLNEFKNELDKYGKILLKKERIKEINLEYLEYVTL